MGKLYLVSTPIGNMEDITLRAIRILGEVDIIACEDTRKTGLLLNRLNHLNQVEPGKRLDLVRGSTSLGKNPRLLSYYEENEPKRIPELIQYLKEDKNVALVSNAGTPTISDPGYKLVRQCLNQGINVEAVPGASAVLSALVSSGLPIDKFFFLGFLPKKESKKKELFESLKTRQPFSHLTIIFYESPYRILKSLQLIKELLGDIEIVICEELTKMFEKIRREKISESLKHFDEVKPRGEYTLLFRL